MNKQQILDGHDEFQLYSLLNERGLAWVLDEVASWQRDKDELDIDETQEAKIKRSVKAILESAEDLYDELI